MAEGEDKDSCLAKFRVRFKNMTADAFVEYWNKYDKDGNGYIEGSELEYFFKECIEDIESDESLQAAIKYYMKHYDENNDNRIEMMELAEILQPEENFLLLFRSKETGRTSQEFYKIWTDYDVNHDGFIDKSELKSFLKSLTKVPLTDEKLQSYTDAMLKLFDVDKDNKLSFKEMLRLVPVKENIFLQFESSFAEDLMEGLLIGSSPAHAKPEKKVKVSYEDFKRVFQHYDKDKNNVISGEELEEFLNDLVILRTDSGPVNKETLQRISDDIMKTVDKNADQVITESELKMFLGVTSEEA